MVDAGLVGGGGALLVGGGGSEAHAVLLRSGEELLKLAGGQGGEVFIAPLREEGGAASAPPPLLLPPALPPALPLVPPPLPLPDLVELPPPRLLIDSSLGRLVRWLRVVGVDAEARSGLGAAAWAAAHRPAGALHSPLSSMELVQWANQSRRVLVTRDSKVLARREGCAALWVAANDCATQFLFVCDALAIRIKPSDLMSRCSKCNSLGYKELSPDEVRVRDQGVPEKVFALGLTFYACKLCEKIYWEGNKYATASEKYRQLFEG